MYRKYIEGVRAALKQMAEVEEAVKYPHMMYDPKTGKEVEAKTPADHAKFAKMGYTHEKPKMDEAVTSADKKPENVVGPDGRMRVRMVPVTKKSEPKEQMYQIPEDIPQNERTAFHGAAAAAAKAGKKSFNFGGKTHPVTMKKDVATKIADQKEGTMNEEHSKTNKASMTIKHGYDEGDGPDNKKFAKYINKNTGATVKHHKDGSTMSFHGSDHQIHKALQHHYSDDKKGLGDLNYHKQGKTHSDDHVDGQHTYQKEAKEEVEEMNINEKYRYTVDLYHKDHGTHDSFIKKAKAAGIKGAYSGVNKDGKVKVSLNHHDNSDGGVIHKFLKKHYDKDMTHGNMQTMQTGAPTKESLTYNEETNHVYVNDLNKGGLNHAKKAGMTVTHHGPSEFGHRATISHNDSKKLAKYVDRHLGGMDQVQKRTSTKESTIRDRLMGIWEEAGRAQHYKGATKPEPMTKDDERSAKKMKDGHSVKKDDHEETSGAAEKSTKPSAMRGNDNKQGDKNIIPSATKDTPANKTTKEQFDALAKAYEEVKNGN